LVAGHTEPRVFIFDALDGAGLVPSWSFGHQIVRQRFEQLGPELTAFLPGLGLAHRVGELA